MKMKPGEQTSGREKAKKKLIEELNKLKPYSTGDVWKEILKDLKKIKQVEYTIPDDGQQAERAQRIRKEKQTIVNGRIVFRAYENMGFGDLYAVWKDNPEIQNDFPTVWGFIHFIAKIFPNSEARKLAEKRRPEDYPQPGKSRRVKPISSGDGQTGETEKKSPPVTQIVRSLLANHPEWESQPTMLLAKVNKKATDQGCRETKLTTLKSTLTRMRNRPEKKKI